MALRSPNPIVAYGELRKFSHTVAVAEAIPLIPLYHKVSRRLRIMNSNVEFLIYLGISAQVVTDDSGNPLIQMPTAHYEPRRNLIDPWYILVSQTDDQCFFRERKHASGLTPSEHLESP